MLYSCILIKSFKLFLIFCITISIIFIYLQQQQQNKYSSKARHRDRTPGPLRPHGLGPWPGVERTGPRPRCPKEKRPDDIAAPPDAARRLSGSTQPVNNWAARRQASITALARPRSLRRLKEPHQYRNLLQAWEPERKPVSVQNHLVLDNILLIFFNFILIFFVYLWKKQKPWLSFRDSVYAVVLIANGLKTPTDWMLLIMMSWGQLIFWVAQKPVS